MRFLFAFALVFTLATNSLAEPRWTYLADDLEKLELPCGENRLFSAQIFFLRSALKKYRIGVVRASDFAERRESVRTLCEKSSAAACINANFFDEQGKALGLVISRGIIYQKLHRFGNTLTAIFQVIKGKPSIVHRDEFLPDSVVEAVQAGPRLIVEGAATKGVRESSHGTNLSGLCIDNLNRVVFYRVTSSVFGCGIDELQRVLLSEALECRDALNFDGGGSSELYISSNLPGGIKDQKATVLEGGDPVPVVVGLFGR